jgi:anthranilate synthase
LYALPKKLPAQLKVTAVSEDGVIMAIEHKTLPISAVQFHPESIMTLAGGVGMAIVQNISDSIKCDRGTISSPRTEIRH